MKKLFQLAFLCLMLVTTQAANASNKWYSFQYVPDAGSEVSISTLTLWLPENFTGRMIDGITGLWEMYANGPFPRDLYAGTFWLDNNINPTGFSYQNPEQGIDYFLPRHDLTFIGWRNSWEFVNGEVVGWSLNTARKNGEDSIWLHESDLGGRWSRSLYIRPIPEPSSYVLLGLGIAMIGFARRSRS